MRFRQVKKLGAALFVALLMAGLIAFPQAAAEAARDGLLTCFQVIIPSLFPFFVLASLCIALGLAGYMGQYLSPLMRPLFGVSGSGATALVLGLVGGYPLGAKAVASLYENGSCTEEEANRLLRFCNNSGPAFVVGAAGAGVFGSTILGLWLYAAHVVAAILTGLLLCRGKPKGPAVPPSIQTSKAQPLSIALVESIKSAFSSVHSICAFVVFFSVAIQLLQSAGILALATEGLVSLGLGQDVAAGLTAGLLEISSGITALQGTPSIGALCAAGFILGWSGLSVHCQAISILSPAGLSARPLILGKLVHGLFSALLIFAGCSLFSGALPVMAPVHTNAETITPLGSLLGALKAAGIAAAILLLACLIAKKAGKRQEKQV